MVVWHTNEFTTMVFWTLRSVPVGKLHVPTRLPVTGVMLSHVTVAGSVVGSAKTLSSCGLPDPVTVALGLGW